MLLLTHSIKLRLLNEVSTVMSQGTEAPYLRHILQS
jgi:hypothetical protein